VGWQFEALFERFEDPKLIKNADLTNTVLKRLETLYFSTLSNFFHE
jgi:hypothetical protein